LGCEGENQNPRWIILLGTDRLESTFGVVRSIVGNDTNADILTLMFRLSHAVECLNIFSEHPDWDCGTRRLNLRGIEDGNGDIVSKADHITPPSWEGDVKLSKVSPITAWNLGRQMVESEFTSAGIEEALIELEKKGHDMTYPFGQGAETTILDSDDDEETEWPLSTVPEPLSVEAAVEKLAATPIGEGDSPLLDIEDHASIETSRDGRRNFNPLVDVGNGNMVSKARVLRELERAMFSRVPGSTDRLNRCAGLTRYTTTTLPHPSLDVTGIDSASNEVLSVGDPAATIVQCEGRFFLAVVQINEICFDGSSLLEISPRFLIEPAVTVQFQIFQVVEAFSDDPDIDGSDWKWNRQMEKAVMKTKGTFIQVISPAVAIPQVNAPVYFFRTDELRAIAAALFSSILLQDHPRLPNLRKRTNHFPYRTKTGIFIIIRIATY